MRSALPHLFAAAPDLHYQLVTMVSPLQLQVSLQCFTVGVAVTGHVIITTSIRSIVTAMHYALPVVAMPASRLSLWGIEQPQRLKADGHVDVTVLIW